MSKLFKKELQGFIRNWKSGSYEHKVIESNDIHFSTPIVESKRVLEPIKK